MCCNSCITAKFNEIDRSQPALVHCPICNMASQPDKIIMNQFLIEMSEANADDSLSNSNDPDSKTLIKCSSCSDDETATSWCVECSEYICDSCVQAHQRLKITKDHTIKTREEALAENQSITSEEKALMCNTHVQEKLSLFCETCDKLTCRDCQLVDHRDHKYKFANEIAVEARTELSTLLGEITYKRVLLNSAMNVIDDRQKLFCDKKKELINEIKNMVMKITNTVNMRGKQLVVRLNEVTDTKLKVLNEKKEALQQLSSHTDHCIDFVKAALDKGSDSAVLFSKKTLSHHLQKVKCQRADIPNPEIPVRIQVQMNQIAELQKVISNLGIILVDGKVYPPVVSPGLPGRQQPSPNQMNPLQPSILPQQIPAQQAPPQVPAVATLSGLPPSRSPQMSQQNMNNFMTNLYNSTSPLQQDQTVPPPTQQSQQFVGLTRSYSQDSPIGSTGAVGSGIYGRFSNMVPRQNFRQTSPHVSSSTHPQNIGKTGIPLSRPSPQRLVSASIKSFSFSVGSLSLGA